MTLLNCFSFYRGWSILHKWNKLRSWPLAWDRPWGHHRGYSWISRHRWCEYLKDCNLPRHNNYWYKIAIAIILSCLWQLFPVFSQLFSWPFKSYFIAISCRCTAITVTAISCFHSYFLFSQLFPVFSISCLFQTISCLFTTISCLF